MIDLDRAEKLFRQELRFMVEEAKGMRARLVLMEGLLAPTPEETSEQDLQSHPEGVSALRIAIQVILKDHLGPLLRELLAVDEQRKSSE